MPCVFSCVFSLPILSLVSSFAPILVCFCILGCFSLVLLFSCCFFLIVNIDILEYVFIGCLPILLLFSFCFQFVLGIIMKILESTMFVQYCCFPTRTSTPFPSHQHTSPTAHRFHSHSRHTPGTPSQHHKTQTPDANTRHTFTLSQLQFDKAAQNFRWKLMAKILRPERGSFLPGVFLFFLHCDETVGVHFLCMQTTFIVAGMCVAFFNFSSVLLPCPPAMPLQFKPHTTRK